MRLVAHSSSSPPLNLDAVSFRHAGFGQSLTQET